MSPFLAPRFAHPAPPPHTGSNYLLSSAVGAQTSDRSSTLAYHSASAPLSTAFADGSSTLHANPLEQLRPLPPAGPLPESRYVPASGSPSLLLLSSRGANEPARYGTSATGTISGTGPSGFNMGIPPPKQGGSSWDRGARDRLTAAAGGSGIGYDAGRTPAEALSAEGLYSHRLRYGPTTGLPASLAGPPGPSQQPPRSSSDPGAGAGVFKSSTTEDVLASGPLLVSPTPHVPRASEMAILLNHGAGTTHEYRDEDHELRMPVAHAVLYPDVSEPFVDDDLDDGFLSREKKHGCTMCHKRFDRPSTLKKHLLVHTGEKAFQCSICQRRFGVMSNLNRHIRRCSQREVHSHGSTRTAALVAAAAAATLAASDTGKRGRSPSTTGNSSTPRKRRRRAPSPSRWIPASLRSFNILPPESNTPVEVPLPPVSPGRKSANGMVWDEDRDSEENFGRAPYSSAEWEKHRRLPGPCALSRITPTNEPRKLKRSRTVQV